jgi:hypothetical protein
MAQNNLIGLVTGFFSSKAAPAHVYLDSSRTITGSSELTGVARYLDTHKASTVSSVSKYLSKQEKVTVSGVSKYLLRKSIAERSSHEVTVATGVEKYLKTRKVTVPVVRSGVAKYLDNIEKTNVSRVTKYLVKKNLADRNKPAQKKITKVAEYLESHKENVASGVSKYLTRQMLAEKRSIAAVESVVTVLTGVERYLQSHA